MSVVVVVVSRWLHTVYLMAYCAYAFYRISFLCVVGAISLHDHLRFCGRRGHDG